MRSNLANNSNSTPNNTSGAVGNQSSTSKLSSLKQPSALKSKISPPTQLTAAPKASSSQINQQHQQVTSNFKDQYHHQQSPLPVLHSQQKSSGNLNIIKQQSRPPTSQSSALNAGGSSNASNTNTSNIIVTSNSNSNAPYQQPISLFINKIIGTTSSSQDNFVILSECECAYLAQSFIVVYNFVLNVQVLHYQNPNNKPYRALTYNAKKQYLLAGEGNTKQGEIHVFRLQQQQQTQSFCLLEQIMVLKGHKYGIKQIKTNNEGDLVISVGDDNDKGLILWETISPRILSANLFKNSQINGACFLPNNITNNQATNTNNNVIQFLTYGTNGHLKVWSVEIERDQFMVQYHVESFSEVKQGQTIPKLIGLKLQITEQQTQFNFKNLIINNSSISTSQDKSSQSAGSLSNNIYILGVNETEGCTLFKYNFLSQKLDATYKVSSNKNLDAYTMIQDEDNKQLIVSGSISQRLQCYDQQSLKLNLKNEFNWAQPPQKGQLQMISQEIYDYLISQSNSSNFSDQNAYSQIKGIILNEGIFVQILEDGMILIHDYVQQKLIRVLIQHSDAINDLIIKEYSNNTASSAADNHNNNSNCSSGSGQLLQLSYLTCSKDGTLRLWNTHLGNSTSQQDMNDYPSNPLDGDLKRIIQLDQDQLAFQEIGSPNSNCTDESGIKCIAYNHMRNQLAVGDMLGNIRLYQLSPENHQYLHQVNFIEAHEGKVVALQYSEPFSVNNSGQYKQFLVSASSDRMIHIFDARTDDYELVQTIDAHTTSIIDAKFIQCTIGIKNKHKITQYEKQLRLYTCSSDKTLLTHKYNAVDGKFSTLTPKDLHKNKIYKIALTESHLILAKDQGFIEIKQLETNKQVQLFQQQGSSQTHSKQMLDYTNMTISQDTQLIALNDKEKTIQIRETRQCSSQLAKYSLADNLSSLQFTNDNKYLICSSQSSKDQGGGIIYIFKVVHSLPAIRKEQSLIQIQRNADKVIVVDNYSSNSKGGGNLFNPTFDSQSPLKTNLQQNPSQRKFTVREDLFNTWAKSNTSYSQQYQQQQQQQQQQLQNDTQNFTSHYSSNQLRDSLNQDQFIEQKLAVANLNEGINRNRSTTVSPPSKQEKIIASQNQWLQKQQSEQQPFSQLNVSPPKPLLLQIQTDKSNDNEDNKKGIEDFIQELESDNNYMDDEEDENLLEEMKMSIHINNQKLGIRDNLLETHSNSSSEVKVQEMPDGELHRKVTMNMTNNMNDKNRSTLTQRTSLTMRYLIETPRIQNSITRDLSLSNINKDDRGAITTNAVGIDPEEENFQNQVQKYQKRATAYQTDNKLQEIKEKSNYERFTDKIDKIFKNAQHFEELEMKEMSQEEKLKISLKINQAIQQLSLIGGFASGVALSSLFVCNMNDIIYSQLRRNIILPFSNVLSPQTNQNRNLTEDIKGLGSGTMNFVSQFKPHALGPANAKQLLMTDQNYGTPTDNYFGYLTKRKQENIDDNFKELIVLENLGLKQILPPYYNPEKNRFEVQNMQQMSALSKINIKKDGDDAINNVQAIEDFDPIELARINAIREQSLEKLQSLKQEQQQQAAQKHSKKDYEKLKTMTINQILAQVHQETVKRKFEDDTLKKDKSLDEVVKIEKKKEFSRKKRSEQRQKDREIQEMLKNPQDINYEKAMKIYEEQPLEAKQITARDKRRLRRLKQKAEQDVTEIDISSSQKQTEKQQQQNQQQAASLRIDSKVDSENFSDENIDSLIK